MNRWIYVLLFLVGALSPTSLTGTPLTPLILGGYAASLLLLFACAVRFGVDEKMVFCVSGPIVIVLLLATVVATTFRVPFAEAHWGNLLNFACIAFVYCIPFEKMKVVRPERVLGLVSAFNITVGTGLLIANAATTDLIVRYYSSITPDMVTSMLETRKPVITYAAHSIAALFLYLFFYANLRAFRSTGKRLYLLMSVGHIFLCLALLSHTSIVLSAAAVFELLWLSIRSRPKLTVALIAIVIYAVVSLSPIPMAEAAELGSLWWEGTGGSGFLGRYSSQGYGSQLSQIQYINNSPAVPIGIMDSPTINPFSVDSGPVDYMLRGSLPLLALMYAGLWMFLRKRLATRSDAYHMFLAILAVESGIEITTYHRSLCLLPAFVLLLSNLRVSPQQSSLRMAAKLASN